MSEQFDPYHEWLGIPASEQPPHHYRLLGIPAFEESPTVIENAADRQMAHLRTFQTGKHSAESQRLLNEISAARVCLLHPAKRAAYDQQLRDTLQAQQPKTADEAGVPAAFEFLDQETPSRKTAPAKPRTGIYLAAAAVAALVLIAVVWAVFFSGGGSGATNLARQPQTPEPVTPKVVEPAKPPPPPAPAQAVVRTSPPRVPKPASVVEAPPAKPEPAGAIAKTLLPGEPKPAPENPPVKPEEPVAPTAAKRPVPDEAAIAKALEVARQSFKEDYERAKTPAEKVALAEKLRETAGQAAGGPAEHFVLLRLARDVATKAGDAKAAFAAIDEMQKAFSIDDLAMKSEALAAMAGKSLKPDDRKALAEAALGLVKRAIDAESLDAAEEAMKTAGGLAGKVHDRELTQRVQAARKQLAENVKAAGEVQVARDTLKDKPDDPDANLALGKYLCFVRSQWPEGLKRLAAGSDEPLKALAQRELKSTTGSPEESARLGDAWWNLSRAAGGKSKEGMMLRAGTWYQEAEASLPAGLAGVMVEKRLAEIEKLGREIPELPGGPPPAVAPFDAKKAKSLQVRWARRLKVPVVQTNSIGMKFVLIPPGEFQMGSPKELIEEEMKTPGIEDWYKERLPAEGPQHRVRITKPFYLGTYLVTQGEYQRVTGVNPSEFSATGQHKDQVAGQETKQFPVEHVSWDDAVEFCRKLSEMPEEKAAGRWYRLPSEAQWEYACRAGSTGRFSFSPGGNAMPREYEDNALSDYGWYNGNSGGMPHAVGGKRPSAWGLYDMHGNVWEWCQDWYDVGYYVQTPVDDPTGPLGGSYRVNRGGSWNGPARGCRSANRSHGVPGNRDLTLGFRASLVLAENPGGKSPAATAMAPVEHDAQVEATPGPSKAETGDGDESALPAPGGRPPPAVAPLDAITAKAIQARWAKYLKLPVVTTNSIGIKLVLIPPGEFEMGSPADEKDRASDEGPQHRVKISRSFHMGAYPVTQAQYELLMGRKRGHH
jgi:formylglycine-generating enzyme required for sulfatase activity